MEKYVAAKRAKNELCRAEHSSIATNENSHSISYLWRRVTVKFIDHILYQAQWTQSPTFLTEALVAQGENENWLSEYVSNMHLSNVAKRHLHRFLYQWINAVESAVLLFDLNVIQSINICFGKSLQRLSRSFSVSFSSVCNEELLTQWHLLSCTQQQEYCGLLERMVVREFLRISPTESIPLKSNCLLRERAFLCLETCLSVEDECMLFDCTKSASTLWENFRTLTSEMICIIPKTSKREKAKINRSSFLKKIASRRQNDENNETNDFDAKTRLESNAEIETEAKCFSIRLFSSQTETPNLEQSHIWIVPTTGIKPPK
jgi:hypothetical protein